MTVTPPRTPPTGAERTDERPSPADRARQVTVTAAELFCVLGTLVGVGVLGTPVASSSGGALSADATLLAPAGPAFSIWSVDVRSASRRTRCWQWLPSQATAARATARSAWLAAASMVLNAAWLLVTQQGWLWVERGSSSWRCCSCSSVLVVAPPRAAARAGEPADRVVRDGTFGLYLGWVAVASFANVAAGPGRLGR